MPHGLSGGRSTLFSDSLHADTAENVCHLQAHGTGKDLAQAFFAAEWSATTTA